MKTCTHCRKEKNIDQFNKAKKCKLGRRPECKTCERRRGSYYIKSINFRIRHHPQWYAGIQNRLTSTDIESIPDVCYFCSLVIEDSMSIHRLDHSGHYEADNIAKVHKTCHAIYGGHTSAPNPSKGFGSMDKDKANEIRKKAYMARLTKKKDMV